jgi:capsular polysaccharide transport system permease protein
MTDTTADSPQVTNPSNNGEKRKMRKPAARAHLRLRHIGLMLTFVIMVCVPVGFSGWYLYARAADQYASTLGFTVRSEDVASAMDLFSGISSSLGGSSSHDSDILYEFIHSQQLVRNINEKLNIKDAYSRYHDTDPLLSYDASGTIENLTAYWQRMVQVSYDTGSGLIELRVLAFAPTEAKAIAQEIYDESLIMINALSAIAREDGTRYAREDLDFAVERVKVAREALTTFRLTNQIVDPSADIQGQVGLLNTLQNQQAAALIEYDMLAGSVRGSDPRLEQAQRRISVIEQRITEERHKFGADGEGPGGGTYAKIIADFERLSADREFAENAYAAAQAAFEGARAESNRQSRYLAAYIQPTIAEKAEFPQRVYLLSIVALFSFLIWTISTLIYYALRDRG